MEARAKFLGHPIHQMLIVLPLGSLVGAVLFDLCRLAGGGEQMAVVAYWMIALGVLSGLLAAVFGVIDWTKIPRGTRAHRVGLAHGIGNVLVVLLFTVSWLLRTGDPANPGLAAVLLALAGLGGGAVTGWLGGELVARLGVGVDDGAHLDAPSSLKGPVAEVR